MIITLCSSARFFDRLWNIEKHLKENGFDVLLPSMKNYHGLSEDHLSKIQHDLIKGHYKKIDRSHAVYVANFSNKGIEGYIGGNTFLEMGKAFDKGIPIFLHSVVPKMDYRGEILAMKPIVVGNNWYLLDKFMKEFYRK